MYMVKPIIKIKEEISPTCMNLLDNSKAAINSSIKGTSHTITDAWLLITGDNIIDV